MRRWAFWLPGALRGLRQQRNQLIAGADNLPGCQRRKAQSLANWQLDGNSRHARCQLWLLNKQPQQEDKQEDADNQR